MLEAQINASSHRAPGYAATTQRGAISPIDPIAGARSLVGMIRDAALVQIHEVALMASIAAMMPLHLIGRGFGPASGARPQAQADCASAARPVLLVHGFGGTKSSWSLLARNLSARGLTFDAITYTPFGTSVEQLADRLVAEVWRVLSQTGTDKVHLVGHSLGGVVIAQAIASGRLAGQVDTVVTLAAPFGGSPWAALLPFGAIARALREDSPLLRRLASVPMPDGVRWLAFTSRADIIVPGLRSVPAHPEVQTVTVRGVGHNGMLLSQQVVEHIVSALAA
jgi:triacylglycerol lipase